jgi:hypothetical protein
MLFIRCLIGVAAGTIAGLCYLLFQFFKTFLSFTKPLTDHGQYTSGDIGSKPKSDPKNHRINKKPITGKNIVTIPILAVISGLILLVWSADRFVGGASSVVSFR